MAKKASNAEPLDAPINEFLAVNGHSTSIFSKVIGLEIVPRESADVYARERIDFTSNSVIHKSPKFMDLGLSPAHTPDKIKSVVGPATKVKWLANISDWLASRHGIEEVTVVRAKEIKAYSDYIKNSEFETINFF